MIALPFVYFSFLLYVSMKKNGLTVGSYIILLFLISSLCSVLVDILNLYTDSCLEQELGIFAPFLYISTLSFLIWPFYKFQINKISIPKKVTITKIKFVVCLYLVMFFIVLLVSLTRITEVITSNALASIRYELYSGDTISFYDHLSGYKRYICAICNIISPSAFIMILIFVYLVTFVKKHYFLKVCAILSSFTPLLISINIADRSQYFYWVAMLGFSIVLFRPFMEVRSKQFLYTIISIFLVLIISYFTAVTISRFGERDGGASGGIIVYAGQSYVNFCMFINKLVPPISVNIIFPIITQLILGGDSYFAIANQLENAQNIYVCVFPSFLGIIYSVSGGIVTTLFCLFYRWVSSVIIGKSCNRKLGINNLIIIWIIAIVPVIGVMTYFYLNSGGTIALIIWFLLSRVLKD